MKSKAIILFLSFVSLISCKNESKAEDKVKRNSMGIETEIKTISAMKKVMMGEDLSAHINWDTIPKDNLFAVCPLGRIQGEVTIIDGKMFTSRVDDKNNIIIENNWNINSPFAVYAFVKSWHEIEIDTPISNEEELQSILEISAEEIGIKTDNPFVFRIEGSFDKVDYHIISKSLEEKKHSHELHDEAKKHFRLNNVEGQLLGFYSLKHEGVFTHRGHFIHTHFIDNVQKNMGHLENVIISKKLKIFISK